MAYFNPTSKHYLISNWMLQIKRKGTVLQLTSTSTTWFPLKCVLESPHRKSPTLQPKNPTTSSTLPRYVICKVYLILIPLNCITHYTGYVQLIWLSIRTQSNFFFFFLNVGIVSWFSQFAILHKQCLRHNF